MNTTILFARVYVGFTFPLPWDVDAFAICVTSNVGYDYLSHVMTQLRAWEKSYHTFWRHTLDMTISHMAVSQSETVNSFK